MKKFGHLYIDLYGFNVYFIRGSRTLYENKIEAEFDVTPPDKRDRAATFEVYAHEGRLIGVIWLCESAGRDHLTHEIFHAVHFLLDSRGMRLTDASEEAYAYLLQFMFYRIEKEMFRGRVAAGRR